MTCPSGIQVICTSEWKCEKNTEGNNTGWNNDGCGIRKYDLIGCPIAVQPAEIEKTWVATAIGLTLLSIGILGIVISSIKKK